MRVTEIPFVRQVGIYRNLEGALELPFDETVRNHLGTVHASAQCALAETASGDFLGQLFPDLLGKVIPVVRKARVKFNKPARKRLTAYSSVPVEARVRFIDQFKEKGSATINVHVELRDEDDTITCQAQYEWVIRKAGAHSKPEQASDAVN